MKKALVVGGSSGLGLELAKLLAHTHEVTVTGRKDPVTPGITFRKLDIDRMSSREDVWNSIRNLLSGLSPGVLDIELLVYAAGYYQEAYIEDLSPTQIYEMVDLGLVVPALMMNRLKSQQAFLPGFIAITSTSQWTPREKEPLYTAVKAGLGMFANSLSLDQEIGKVLVAGPAGMKTSFWRNDPEKDISSFLEPSWVAEQILTAYGDDFKYKFIKLMRDPARVEVVEKR